MLVTNPSLAKQSVPTPPNRIVLHRKTLANVSLRLGLIRVLAIWLPLRVASDLGRSSLVHRRLASG
jgi:hypothetical protein